MKITIERADQCPLVKQRSEPNGHDCWGNYEYTTHDYVTVNGTSENVFDSEYIVHDGEKVLGTGLISLLPDNLRKLLDAKFHERMKAERRELYLKLKKEFEQS